MGDNQAVAAFVWGDYGGNYGGCDGSIGESSSVYNASQREEVIGGYYLGLRVFPRNSAREFTVHSVRKG